MPFAGERVRDRFPQLPHPFALKRPNALHQTRRRLMQTGGLLAAASAGFVDETVFWGYARFARRKRGEHTARSMQARESSMM
jgi:hypothetical protein